MWPRFPEKFPQLDQAQPSRMPWTINYVCEDLHKSNKRVIGTARQIDHMPWIFDWITVSIFVCDSSLPGLLGPFPTIIQAITMEIYT